MQEELILFREYRNEFPLNTIRTWSRDLEEQTQWSYTGWTGEPKEPLRHWAHVRDEEPTGLLGEIWAATSVCLNEDGFKLKPHRILLNLFAHGDSSWLHKDSNKSTDWTVILYMNDRWDIAWGGDTVLIENNEILHCCAATPGKVLLFRSDLIHGARPVSREAPYPRFGLTFQCVSNG